jgi:hypothetical protein
MNELEKLAERIQRKLPKIKSGTLRFWGEWFGRPYDNWHQLVRCEVEQNVLRLVFNEQEILSVWAPSGLEVDHSTFRISTADRVRWEWFYYGRPKTPSNLYFLDFVRSATGISATTNVDWYEPNLKPRPSEAAVEIL